MKNTPARRVVVLGASNVARGMRYAVEAAQACWGTPLEFMAAAGHGRSYGQPSRVLGRTLPGILECGLWKVLANGSPHPATAVVTDIGNDLVYNAPVTQVAQWVETCLQRLAEHCESIAISELPLASVRHVGNARYLVFRTLLFPRCRLDLATVLERAEQLNAEILRLAEKFSARIISPAGEWYGLDPIHVKRSFSDRAWRLLMSQSEQNGESAVSRGGLFRSLYLKSLVPNERRVLGITQQRVQPTGKLPDGTTIALF